MGAPINDQFSDLECRQRRYQLRKKAARLCTQCGRARALPDMTRCAKCHKRAMKLVYQHQGKPRRKAKTSKFIRAMTVLDPPEVK